MRLSLDLATRYMAGERPWKDSRVSRPEVDTRKFDHYGEERYDAAIAELREALVDGRWHEKAIARDIAKRHKCGLVSLCDRAGVYFDGEEIIWPGA
jgi:hypothetical protein